MVWFVLFILIVMVNAGIVLGNVWDMINDWRKRNG